jgi:hypothetical protein
VTATRAAALVRTSILVLAAWLVTAGCDRRVHVVGRILADASILADAREEAVPDAPAEAASPADAADQADADLSCRPGGACSASVRTGCVPPCGAGDAGVSLCNCESSRWLCQVESDRCGTADECTRRQACGESPPPTPCRFCDSGQGKSVLCACDQRTRTWQCTVSDTSCD